MGIHAWRFRAECLPRPVWTRAVFQRPLPSARGQQGTTSPERPQLTSRSFSWSALSCRRCKDLAVAAEQYKQLHRQHQSPHAGGLGEPVLRSGSSKALLRSLLPYQLTFHGLPPVAKKDAPSGLNTSNEHQQYYPGLKAGWPLQACAPARNYFFSLSDLCGRLFRIATS